MGIQSNLKELNFKIFKNLKTVSFVFVAVIKKTINWLVRKYVQERI
jgi:hypothetical protein